MEKLETKKEKTTFGDYHRVRQQWIRGRDKLIMANHSNTAPNIDKVGEVMQKRKTRNRK